MMAATEPTQIGGDTRAAVTWGVMLGVPALLYIAALFGGLYGLVRFVKWAWVG